MKKFLILSAAVCLPLMAETVFLENFNQKPEGWETSPNFQWLPAGGRNGSGAFSASRENAKTPLSAMKKISLDHNTKYRFTIHYRTEMKPSPGYNVQEIFALKFFKNGKPATGLFSARREPGSRKDWGSFTIDFSLPGDSDKTVQIGLLLRTGRIGQIWYDDIKIEKLATVQKPDTLGEPYLTHPDVGRITVNFVTVKPMAAAVDYRPAGTKNWKRVYDLLGGQARNDKNEHHITLTGLVPNQKYEYRTVLLPIPELQMEFYSDVKHFVSVSDKPTDFSVFYTSDTQTAMKTRIDLLRDFRKNCKLDQVPLIIHGGDITSYYDKSSREIFLDTFVNVFTEKNSFSPMFTAVRGNHEYRGLESGNFFRYLSGGTDKSYFAFTYGHVYFIVLDVGETTPRIAHLLHYARNYEIQMLDEQRIFLKQAVASKEFQNAEFRIVIAHAPYIKEEKNMMRSIDRIAKGILFDTENPAKIHLWLAGHTHAYSRPTALNSSKQKVFANAKPVNYGANLPFVTLINDGPGCGGPDFSAIRLDFTKGKITVKAMERAGKVFDSFSISADGSIQEISSTLVEK